MLVHQSVESPASGVVDLAQLAFRISGGLHLVRVPRVSLYPSPQTFQILLSFDARLPRKGYFLVKFLESRIFSENAIHACPVVAHLASVFGHRVVDCIGKVCSVW